MKRVKLTFVFALMFMCANYSQSELNISNIDSFLNLMENNDRIMGSVNISIDGETFYQWSGGTSWHLGNDVRGKDGNEIYSIGSISKIFTAVLFYQMVEKGWVSGETKLAEFFPGIPNAELISMDHLLSHRSGLFNFTADSTYWHWKHRDRSQEEMLKLISYYQPVFEPGEELDYSNTNYLLLGYIIEQIRGQDLAVLIHENIAHPLGLTSTFASPDYADLGFQTHSFIRTMDDWVTYVPATSRKMAHAAGGMVSNGADLGVFMDALFNGELISLASLKQMYSTDSNLGAGLIPIEFNDNIGFGHYGGIDEYRTFVAYFPENNMTVSVLLNGLNTSFDQVLYNILSACFESEFNWPELSGYLPEEVKLRSLTGQFINADSTFQASVFVKYGQLGVNINGNEYLFSEAKSPYFFSDDFSGIRIGFQKDRKGEVKNLVIQIKDMIMSLEKRS